MMAEAALAAGFPAENLHVIIDEVAAINAALEFARRGDLLMVFGDAPARCWKQIIYFKGTEAGGTATAAPTPDVLPKAPPSPLGALLDGATLIADGRGVRLARDSDD